MAEYEFKSPSMENIDWTEYYKEKTKKGTPYADLMGPSDYAVESPEDEVRVEEILKPFKKESPPVVEEKSFWDKRKEDWNERWQDPEMRQGMIDVGVKGIQDLITAPSRTRAAIGDIYTKTRMGQPSRSLDVLAETARPDLYSELRALEGKNKAKADAETRKERWNRLLELNIQEREKKLKDL